MSDPRTLQELSDIVNKAYLKATITDTLNDFRTAAFIARELVLTMAKRGIISDSLPVMSVQAWDNEADFLSGSTPEEIAYLENIDQQFKQSAAKIEEMLDNLGDI